MSPIIKDFSIAQNVYLGEADLGISKYKAYDQNYLKKLSRNLKHNLKDINSRIKVPVKQAPI